MARTRLPQPAKNCASPSVFAVTIRRSQCDDQGRDLWVIISQIEHARIAGELAEVWHEDVFASPAAREELVAAAFHHDDGWAEWELQPGVDDDGRPRTFTEMPLGQALQIWRASITTCEAFGPLAAMTTAAHFSYLLRHAELWQARPTELGHHIPAPDAETHQAAAWLEEYDERRQEWMVQWRRQRPECHTAAAAAAGLMLLQLWDRMSLWLCCSEPTEPFEIEAPHEPVTMIPISPGHVQVRPWPLKIDVYRPQVEAARVPVARYTLAEALAAVDRSPVTLTWELRAGAGSESAP